MVFFLKFIKFVFVVAIYSDWNFVIVCNVVLFIVMFA